ncbi:MAG: RecX family transcriptional regulator [Bacteroidia bacterium]|nr:RecX family transcriptional regulator [Bacteroidia bacterium]
MELNSSFVFISVNYKEKQLNLSPKQELEKIKRWCAYQERSHNEARIKLQRTGLKEHEIEVILSELISENFLNEERFAKAFAGGKFRIKHWGRVKIKMDLKKHRVSEPNIQMALDSIDETAYKNTIQQLAEKRLKTSGNRHIALLKASVYRYLTAKGFESDLVMEQINTTFDTHES